MLDESQARIALFSFFKGTDLLLCCSIINFFCIQDSTSHKWTVILYHILLVTIRTGFFLH